MHNFIIKWLIAHRITVQGRALPRTSEGAYWELEEEGNKENIVAIHRPYCFLSLNILLTHSSLQLETLRLLRMASDMYYAS